MKVLNVCQDKRNNCLSVITVMTLKEYKEIAYDSFVNCGNLSGQRNVISKSTIASKIRKRMNEDFKAGALFPSVVLGLLAEKEQIESILDDAEYFINLDKPTNNISIIDGMQRSNIYFSNYENNESRLIRVEFWISDNTISMLYRMLVLNTGQVPWNTKRQVEVIFGNLTENIIASVEEKNSELSEKITIMGVDDHKRRTQPGKYNKSTLLELYLGYNTRKVKVSVDDMLAEEFQRFDMIESVEKGINFELFIDAFSSLCRLDFAFSEYTKCQETGLFKDGKDIFGSLPVCVGFMVACAEYVMGKISVEREEDVKKEKNTKMASQINAIIALLNKNHDNKDFLALDTLNEIVASASNSASRIGDEMRTLFKTVFFEMLKYEDLDELTSFQAFWRS